MRFKMNVAKHTIAIFIIVGISGLLYTSSFLPSAFAQNTTNSGTGSQQQGAGTFKELQNLTGSKGNKDLLANNTPISNSSLSSGMQLEQDTDKSKAGQETDEQKLGHNPQGQVGPALESINTSSKIKPAKVNNNQGKIKPAKVNNNQGKIKPAKVNNNQGKIKPAKVNNNQGKIKVRGL